MRVMDQLYPAAQRNILPPAKAGDAMRFASWKLLSLAAVLLTIAACKTPAANPPGAASPATEHALKTPGTYIRREVDRGGPVPEAVAKQDILAGLSMGRVLFACPPEMRVQTPERVEVRITGDPKQDITQGLEERGIPIETAAKISPVMKVTLNADADDAFEVKQLTDAQQSVVDGGGQWAWSVTPLKAGKHNLYLTASAVVNVPGFGQQTEEIPVLTQSVQVRADVAYSASQFWHSNWQWLFSTLLIPLGLWLWNKRSKKKA